MNVNAINKCGPCLFCKFSPTDSCLHKYKKFLFVRFLLCSRRSLS